MSRPIYEPTLPRTDAQLGYGNRQLFRRPAPQGEAETTDFPYGYIAWFQGDDIANGVGTIPGPFDEAFVNPAGMVDNGFGEPLIDPDLPNSFLRIWPDNTLQYCWVVTVTAGWSDSVPAGGQMGVENVVGMGGFFGNFDVTSFQDAPTFMNYAANGGMSVTVIRANNNFSAGNDQGFSARVIQTTGGNLWLNELWVEAVGVPAFPVGEGSFTP